MNQEEGCLQNSTMLALWSWTCQCPEPWEINVYRLQATHSVVLCYSSPNRQRIWFHIYEIFWVGKSIETERRLVVTRGWESGELKRSVEWARGFFIRRWKWSGVRYWWWLHSILNIWKATELYTLRWLKWWILYYVNFVSVLKHLLKMLQFWKLQPITPEAGSTWSRERFSEQMMKIRW